MSSILGLRDEDRFAVVAYDDHIQVVVPTTEATAEARETGSSIACISDAVHNASEMHQTEVRA